MELGFLALSLFAAQTEEPKIDRFPKIQTIQQVRNYAFDAKNVVSKAYDFVKDSCPEEDDSSDIGFDLAFVPHKCVIS